MDKYKINKGNHYSTYLPDIAVDPRGIKGKFTVNESMVYPKSSVQDEDDLNKIVGLSANIWPFPVKQKTGIFNAPHRLDSFRIAWRPTYLFDTIALFAYYYINGNLTHKELIRAKPLDEISFEIRRSFLFGQWHLNIQRNPTYKSITNPQRKVEQTDFTFKSYQSEGSCLGFIHHPYFGGNSPAPKDMHINLQYNKD